MENKTTLLYIISVIAYITSVLYLVMGTLIILEHFSMDKGVSWGSAEAINGIQLIEFSVKALIFGALIGAINRIDLNNRKKSPNKPNKVSE